MKDTISFYKWILLAFGVVGIGLLFVPLMKNDVMTFSILFFRSDIESFEVILFGGMILPFTIVPINAIYAGVYKEGYYDKITKIILIGWPIMSFIIMLFFKTGLYNHEIYNLTYLPFYYVVLGFFVLETVFNIYICCYSRN